MLIVKIYSYAGPSEDGLGQKAYTAGPWHMRFFRLGKIRIFQIRMTEIQVSKYVTSM